MASSQAEAFCGFYVSSGEQPLYNSATQVVLMREGTKTILSMRNNYRGPAEDFAMVVPVPVVLQKDQVKTLDDAIFDRLNQFTAPRLVEYYEKNPCANRRLMKKSSAMDRALPQSAENKDAVANAVVVEAQFEVGEYEIVVLSAKESNALQSWLETNAYTIPAGAEEVLQSYITQGHYFFVARVNASKVKFDEKGHAVLSPLRFDYDSEDFGLPVRLGLLNARGEQDLLVHIISRQGRYEVANGNNMTIPTNLIVDDVVKDRFADFYEALFSRVHEENPDAVITEYAWGGKGTASQQWTLPVKCDPCTEPTSSPWQKELLSLGADLLEAPPVQGEPGLGLLTSTASVLTLESDVVLAPTQDPATPPQDDEKTPSEPVEPPTYESSQVQALMLGQTEHINQCYESYSRTHGQQPATIDIKLSILPDGSTARIWPATQGTTSQAIVDHLTRCANLDKLAFPAPADGASVEALVRLQFEIKFEDPTWLQINQWTVTRLHARYTAKQLDEDLYFELSAPITGGRGTPQGKDPVLPTTPELSDVNNFQARYIILHPYTSWHMCLNPEPGNWTGSGPSASPSFMEREQTSSTQEEAISINHVVQNKRGWLKRYTPARDEKKK